MKLLIKNGLVISTENNIKEKLDILVENNIIVKISKEILEDCDQVLDAKGLIVSHGFIDPHVHLREPGFSHKESMLTGTMACAAGGFTSVACMPNTNPTIHSKEVVEWVKEKAQKEGCVNVEIIGSISKNLDGKELSDIDDMIEAGILGISDDGKTPMDVDIMLKALDKANKYDIPVISHCEEHNISFGGSINHGKASERTKIKGIPSEAEYIIVKRDIELADKSSAKIHIAHVSTKESVEIIRQAKARGINVTCEVAPHHFSLTDDLISEENTYTKVNPPIRSESDVEAIIEGIFDGTIDMIATDHAPHDEKSKRTEYSKASFGISGIETCFSIAYTELVLKRNLPLERLIEMLTIKPANLLKLNRGSLKEGAIADIAILDLNKKYAIDSNRFYSKGKNTPFDGMQVKGKPVYTIVNGKIVYGGGK